MWLWQFLEEDARNIGGGEGAEAVDLHEDTQLMLVLQHISLDACEWPVGDAYLVALEEGRQVALVDDDVIKFRVDDGAETVELIVGNNKIWVATELRLTGVVIIWCQSGDREFYHLAKLFIGAMHEQQSVVERLFYDDELWLVLIRFVDMLDGNKWEVELARLEQWIAADNLKESVVHLLRTAVSRANGVPIQSIFYRLPFLERILRGGRSRRWGATR